MTEHENERIEALRKGLRALLDMNLEPGVEEVVRRLLGLIGDPTRTMDDVVKALERMFKPLSPEAAARRLTEQLRESAGRRRPPLGRPAGRGAPREKSEDDPRFRAAAKELMDKVKQATKRRHGGV